MELSVVPVSDVISTRPWPEAAHSFDIFPASISRGCVMNCRVWKSKPSKERPVRPRSFRIADVADSASEGCESCELLKALLIGLCLCHPELKAENSTFRWVNYRFTLEVTAEQKHARTFQFFSPYASDTAVIPMTRCNFLTGDTSSDVSFERARQWIRDCEQSHERCDAGSDVALPRRLLDIRPIIDASGRPGIRLADTEGQTGLYACLSHCWGDRTHIKTRTQMGTLSEYLQFIYWDDLPKTFRESILIARKLKLRYIWIDSLCIIQDSIVDWQVESSKMADVYRNSFITIAATGASDSRGGCYQKTVPDACFRIQQHNGLNLLIGVRDCEGLSQRGQKETDAVYAQVKGLFPLFTRAWTFQERKLSRRLLYCNRGELQFACQQAIRCECGSEKLWPHLRRGPKHLKLDMANERSYAAEAAISRRSTSQHLNVLCRSWQATVVAYSQLKLTMSDDKLPALSGCAKDMAKAMGSATYLAGLWRELLVPGLLWFVPPPTKTAPDDLNLRPRPSPWRAPSWSWASVDVPHGVEYIDPGTDISWQSVDGEILAAEVTPTGKDPTGHVASGYIRLRVALGRSYLRYVCLQCTKKGKDRRLRIYTRSESSKQSVCSFLEDGLSSMESPAEVAFMPDFSFKLSDLVDGTVSDLVDSQGRGRCKLAPLSLLHIRHIAQGGQDPDAHRKAFFIALKRVKTEADTFERVGVVMAGYKSGEEREAWFRESWNKYLETEKEITLV